MAEYGEIGAFYGGDQSAFVIAAIPSWSAQATIVKLYGTATDDRRPVLIDLGYPVEAFAVQVADDITGVSGKTVELFQKYLLAPWAFDYIAHQRERDTLPDTTGAIRGHVEADAERIPFAIVHLYYNPTGEKISTTIANANGEFEFLGLTVGSTEYTVMSALSNYNNARETRMAAVTA